MTDYRRKTASELDIFTHLVRCESDFIPPLNQSVDIQEYSKKIFNSSFTFEAWANNELVGLVAAYLNDPLKKSGFITNVSVLGDFKGQGIGSELLKYCMEYAKGLGFQSLDLEVATTNDLATKLYLKAGFRIVSSDINKYRMTLKL